MTEVAVGDGVATFGGKSPILHKKTIPFLNFAAQLHYSPLTVTSTGPTVAVSP